METTITALEVFEQGLTKTSIHCMAQNAIEAVKEQGNILQVAEGISAMETFIKEVKADEGFKEYAREEISKYPKGYVSNSGAKLELAETGTAYDFSRCNDPVYTQLQNEFQDLKEKMKQRETFLKTINIGGVDIITDGGEVVTVFPPSKSSTSSYKITLSR